MTDETKGTETPLTDARWLIFFEDQDVPPEMFTTEAAARVRYEQCRLAYACHLFVHDTAATALVATEKERADRAEGERYKFESQRDHLAEAEHLLRRIVDDLPEKRDWLDPVIERAARFLLAEGLSKQAETVRVPIKLELAHSASTSTGGVPTTEATAWVPVSEQPAPTKGLIDVWNDGTRFTGCYWDHVCREHRCIQAGHLIRLRNVTHWMPLPPPPSGQDGTKTSKPNERDAVVLSEREQVKELREALERISQLQDDKIAHADEATLLLLLQIKVDIARAALARSSTQPQMSPDLTEGGAR